MAFGECVLLSCASLARLSRVSRASLRPLAAPRRLSGAAERKRRASSRVQATPGARARPVYGIAARAGDYFCVRLRGDPDANSRGDLYGAARFFSRDANENSIKSWWADFDPSSVFAMRGSMIGTPHALAPHLRINATQCGSVYPDKHGPGPRGNQPVRFVNLHASLRWRQSSTPSSRRAYMDNVASMAWGA